MGEALPKSDGPAGIRTLDLAVKSRLLYRLSYRPNEAPHKVMAHNVAPLPRVGPERDPALSCVP